MDQKPPPIEESFLDLHGAIVREVVPRIQEALQQAFRAKTRCVLIVHGRGNHGDGTAPVAAATREFLKRLADTPYSVVRRLEFGESSKDIRGGAGCVRVWIALQLSRDQVKFTPQPVQPAGKFPNRKKALRRSLHVDDPQSLTNVNDAGDALKRRYGTPGLGKGYRAADERKGEWPGQR
jgi:hypothetical protein